MGDNFYKDATKEDDRFVKESSDKDLNDISKGSILEIGSGKDMNGRKANGNRKSPLNPLSEEQIKCLQQEIASIHADESIFTFNRGFQTSYNDRLDKISVMADVFPDEGSIHPRDLISARAVLAHEYYGHRAFRGTRLKPGSWNDEFRASYRAAKEAPNLSDEDKYYLILDAVERAREAGVSIRHNSFIRGVLYGY